MDMDYLKTKEDIKFVRAAILNARILDQAEQDLRDKKPIFSKDMAEIGKRFGLALWHSVDDDNYFWEDKNRRHSVTYPNRNIALHKLLDEGIEWLD